ncbi:MAG: DUF2721 domain-containing protein [Blastocatellia bacterium]
MQINVTPSTADLSLLSAMITPAVLISACGTLIFSTSTRLARIVDRVRMLSQQIENELLDDTIDFADERRGEIERQLGIHARRSRLIQTSLTSFYVSLGLFVSSTVSIGAAAFLLQFGWRLNWLPGTFGILGTLFMFYGCVLLIAETRLALRSVNIEMEFVLRLQKLSLERRKIHQAEKAGTGKL